MRSALKYVLPLLILVAAFGIFRLLVNTAPEVETRVPEERAWPVAVTTVSYEDQQPSLSVFGTIVAGRSVEMRALVAGPVVNVGPGLEEGGVVQAGDLLLAVDDFDFVATLDEARAQLREADARLRELEVRRESEQLSLETETTQLRLREREVYRQSQLLERGTVAQRALDDAELALAQTQQAVAARRQSVAAATALLEQQEATKARLDVAVRRAERDLERTQVLAPFDGVVSNVGAELGKRISQNDRVAEIIDPNDLEARFQLSNQQYGRLLSASGALEGQTITVIWTVGDRDLTYTGTVVRVAAEIDATRGGVAVFARLESAGLATPLRPGAFVEVVMRDRLYENVALVPDIAVFDGNTVYEMVPAGEDFLRLKPHTVDVLARTSEGVLIRSDMPDGAQVVITRFAEIGPDVRVRVIDSAEVSS